MPSNSILVEAVLGNLGLSGNSGSASGKMFCNASRTKFGSAAPSIIVLMRTLMPSPTALNRKPVTDLLLGSGS